MTIDQIADFKKRIEPYMEHDCDKKELDTICKYATAYMEHVENIVDSLDKPEVARWMQ